MPHAVALIKLEPVQLLLPAQGEESSSRLRSLDRGGYKVSIFGVPERSKIERGPMLTPGKKGTQASKQFPESVTSALKRPSFQFRFPRPKPRRTRLTIAIRIVWKASGVVKRKQAISQVRLMSGPQVVEYFILLAERS